MSGTDAVIRKSISFPITLEQEISKQATRNNRSFSAQVVHEMELLFKRRKRRDVLMIVGDPVAPSIVMKEADSEE